MAEHGKAWHPVTANTTATIEDEFIAQASGDLWITLFVGKTNGQGSTVTVSDIKIEETVTALGRELTDLTYPDGTAGSFRARDGFGTVDGDGDSATMTCPGPGSENGVWERGLFIDDLCRLESGNDYEVSFDIQTNGASFDFEVGYNKDEDWGGGHENAFGKKDGSANLTASTTKQTVTQTIDSGTVGDGGMLRLRIDLGHAPQGTDVTVSNIRVKNTTENKNVDLLMEYPKPATTDGGFDRRDVDGIKVGRLSGDGNSVTYTPTNDAKWSWALLTPKLCDVTAGTQYQVSFDITTTSADFTSKVHYWKTPWDFWVDGDDTPAKEAKAESVSVSGGKGRFEKIFTPTANGELCLRIDFDGADKTPFTVSNIQVKEFGGSETNEITVGSFGSVWTDFGEGYEGAIIRDKNSAEFVTWKANSNVAPEGWKAKMFIDTGVPYVAGRGYRFSFDITSDDSLREFGAGYNGAESIDSGRWGQTLSAGEKKTIVSHGLKGDTGNVIIVLELGKFNGRSVSAKVSNVQVDEVNVDNYTVHEMKGYVTYDCQDGYSGSIDHQKDSVTVNITDSPARGAEGWKFKAFISNLNIPTSADQGYRISFNAVADQDMDFEVCYNQGDTEKGLGSLSGLHLEAGKMQTIEATCGATESPEKNDLRIQLNLGAVQAPNSITISDLKIERARYNYSSTNAAKIDYQTPSAVSYWAHEDYAVSFKGSDKAITAKITQTPTAGAEGWKIKMFLDTGYVLQPGKYYKVTADVVGKKSQGYEICYNNGGVENGYESMGGLQLVAGKPQTTEKLIFVPTDKTDAGNLMLQFNLGKTTEPNEVTVSGIKVEEVSLAYNDMLAKDFSYTKNTSLWTNPDYTATLDKSASGVVAHVTDASSDPAVWKVKVFVNTGAFLQAGKNYVVRADLQAPNAQNYELCYNNEEIEKGFDVLYNQYLPANTTTTVEKSISVPASMTDAGELVLQFAIGGAAANDVTINNISVQEISLGGSGNGSPAPDTVINLTDAAGKLDVTRDKLTYKMAKISSAAKDNALSIAGANLCAGDLYTVEFTARADKDMTGTLLLNPANGKTAAITEQFQLTSEATTYSFTTKERLSDGGAYDILWQFGSADNQKLGSAEVEISNITVYAPAETLEIMRSQQNVTVNGKTVKPDAYSINGYNYVKLRDLAMLLNDTDAQFAIRYNKNTNSISLTTGKAYTPVGGELTIGADRSATCTRIAQDISVNGNAVNLKAYSIGGYNFFRLRDLDKLLGYKVEYVNQTNTVAITSALTPEAQEKVHDYDIFFLPEVDGESQPYVGDTMPYYENGVYYIYYLKDGGDSYNHSVYVVSTKDFVHYTEYDNPVLSASREDVQDNWIGTGSVVKVDNTYYFFYTGFNSSGSQEYHEKVMVAKSSSPTGTFEKVRGWEIVPPASLGQKNDFRDPQAYYDPATQTISLTITASQDGKARILKYTLDKNLQNAKYDGIIFTDPTGAFWNLECSDTFQLGNKWYLTYSGQDDTLWYAMADSRFGPYTNATRIDGKLFYAAKHVEDGTNSYMVGWARRANSASSTQDVNGWAGNVAVQKLQQQADGTLTLVPVDSIVSAFNKQTALSTTTATLTAGSDRAYKAAFTSSESFMLKGTFTYSGTGSFGLAFDFNGSEDQYKLISLNPATNKLSLSLSGGAISITETKASLSAGQTHSFTYIQDGSVGIFYLDNQAALTVRVYGVTDKPIYLFAENNSVTFTSLQQYTR